MGVALSLLTLFSWAQSGDYSKPTAPADRRTLARRVALDLTGLPPAPADVDAFVRDNAPGAYERLVDRLLATPQYGEHRARYWLDAARYGDTHGIHVVDRASWALVQDLKQGGLLDDTVVIWGGEFGRTIYCQGKLTAKDYGRDHHPRCYSIWMAGGGIKGGVVHGETDEFSYNFVRDPVHVRDWQATLLHCFGLDHEKFSHKWQGLDVRLTGVEPARVVRELLT